MVKLYMISHKHKYIKYKIKSKYIKGKNLQGGYDLDAAEIMYIIQGLGSFKPYIPEEDFKQLTLDEIFVKYGVNPAILSPKMEIDPDTPQWLKDILQDSMDRRDILLEFSKINRDKYSNSITYEKYFHIATANQKYK